MKTSEEENSECMNLMFFDVKGFTKLFKGAYRPELMRQNTVGKMRWNLVRNAIHFIRNTKENKDEENKPNLGKLLSSSKFNG